MKKLTIALILLANTASAQTLTIQPQYMDITSNDGLMDRGSWSNPYVVQDSIGRTQGTIKPRYYDITPNDGLFDAGSYNNPYEVEWK